MAVLYPMTESPALVLMGHTSLKMHLEKELLYHVI